MSLREQKKQQTKEAIIAAARRLFAEKGFEATRTREIAQAAGIATGTLFNYAATKNDVVLLLWKARAGELLTTGLAAAHTHSDPVDALVAVFSPVFSFYAEDIELGRIFVQQAIYADANDPEMLALNEGFIAQLVLLLAPNVPEDTLQAASNAFAAYFLVLTMLLAGRITTPEEAVRLFRELLHTQQKGW